MKEAILEMYTDDNKIKSQTKGVFVKHQNAL